MFSSPLYPVYVIVGPTAIGKTRLSIELAQRMSGVVVSADSQLVYRGLSIGTAKPTLAEQQGVTHHGLDLADPDQAYSAGAYVAYALPLIQQLRQTQPVVVTGGTGFYVRQLFESTTLPDVPPNPTLRQQLQDEFEAAGQSTSPILDRLQALDPARAQAIHPNDLMRLMRAIEIVSATGNPVPTDPRPPLIGPEGVNWLGLQPVDRAWHWQRIEQRITDMVAQGWLAEVADLVAQFGDQAHALQVALGYPEMMAVLGGTLTLEQAQSDSFIAVRQYARRQRVWFARNPLIHWHTIEPSTDFNELAISLLADIAKY
jgi:tRNA dimethylallyltransferase